MKEKNISVLPFLLSGIAGSAVVFLIMLLFSVITVNTGSIETGLFIPVNMVSLCVGALIGGWICGRIIKQKGLLLGIVCAAIVFLATASASLAAGGELSLQLLLRLLLMLPCGALGGILAVNKKKKRGFAAKGSKH